MSKGIRELRAENRQMRSAILELWRMWQSDEFIYDEHGIDEEFGGWMVVAALEAGLYHPGQRCCKPGGSHDPRKVGA